MEQALEQQIEWLLVQYRYQTHRKPLNTTYQNTGQLLLPAQRETENYLNAEAHLSQYLVVEAEK